MKFASLLIVMNFIGQAEPAENPEVLIFRQDYRINKIFCLSGLRPIGA